MEGHTIDKAVTHRYYMWEKDTDRAFPYSTLNKSVLIFDVVPFVGGVPDGKEIVGWFWKERDGLKYHFTKEL